MYSICVLGKDKRIAYAKNLFEKNGYLVKSFTSKEDCISQLQKQRIILLPLPALDAEENIQTVDGALSYIDFVQSLSPNAFVCGGKMPEKLTKALDTRTIKWVDYFACEELTILNAMATAEGAIGLALNALPITLSSSRILITGYGRISRCLTGILRGFRAQEIIIAARSSKDRQWAQLDGATAISIKELPKVMGNVDVIINTIPAPVLGADILWLVKKTAFVLDLASAPGGVDFEAAEELGIHAKWELGIPSKSAPQTAGEGIFYTVDNILRGSGVIHE